MRRIIIGLLALAALISANFWMTVLLFTLIVFVLHFTDVPKTVYSIVFLITGILLIAALKVVMSS